MPPCECQVDNQLLGTTQPVILSVTPSSGESSASDSGPALQVNAVKVPSRLMLTELFKVRSVTRHRPFHAAQTKRGRAPVSVLCRGDGFSD